MQSDSRHAIFVRMTERHIKRPRDPLQLAKLIGDIATGQVPDTVDDKKEAEETSANRGGTTPRRPSATATNFRILKREE